MASIETDTCDICRSYGVTCRPNPEGQGRILTVRSESKKSILIRPRPIENCAIVKHLLPPEIYLPILTNGLVKSE